MKILNILVENNDIHDDDRYDWVDNDVMLYNWWKETGLKQSEFIKTYRDEIDKIIIDALGSAPIIHNTY